MKAHHINIIIFIHGSHIFFSMAILFLATPTATAQPGVRNGSVIRVAVPDRGFSDFVKVTRDSDTGQVGFGGFAIEVFRAVVNKTVTPFEYEFELFEYPNNGSSRGDFDAMLKAVSNQEYDAAVGDISIVDYRTQWVDFTLPWLDTGISMLVPFRQQHSKNTTSIPLGQVTKWFVGATIAFSFIVAIVFWVMEHRNDKYATSQSRLANPIPPPAQQHDDWRREVMRSVIHTRLVMVLFFMILLVLVSCYAASQTSSLSSKTRQKLPIKNINQLIRSGAKVGYQQGSFIKNLLLEKGLLESNLIAFNTDQEMYNLLSNGDVSAVVGLTPHLQLRQAGHCGDYAVVPTFSLQAAGFGFAFQIKAPQVRDMSNGILKLIYNGQMRKIQDRTIGSLDTCQVDDDQSDGDLIDRDTLWILIAGAIGVFLLTIIVLMVQCGISCGTDTTSRKKKKVISYPCYTLPCC